MKRRSTCEPQSSRLSERYARKYGYCRAFFFENLSYDAFYKDRKTVYAVFRGIEIIGEASKKIPTELKKAHSEIPWKEMVGMRDKVIHFYLSLDMRGIWLVLKRNIPRINPQSKKFSKIAKRVQLEILSLWSFSAGRCFPADNTLSQSPDWMPISSGFV